MTPRNSLLACAVLLAAAGCGSTDSTDPGGSASGLSVTVAASTAPFQFSDGAAGQTATHVTAGIRSLTLLTSDGTEWTVFDAGSKDTTVGYNDGDSTPLAHLDSADIVPGHYVKARLVQDWSRFDIQVALHVGSTATPGTLHALMVTSDGTTLDGTQHDAGYYEQDFEGGGQTQRFDGDARVPDYSTTDGAEAVVENGLWSVYFPVDVQIGPEAASLRIVVNMDHAFRWTDVSGGDNQPGVYDIAPPLYEPVTQFGGNRFDASVANH
jgi:hypothetical protein